MASFEEPFLWLRQIQNVVNYDPEDIIDYFLAACIHNLLLDYRIPEEWMDANGISAINDPSHVAN